MSAEHEKDMHELLCAWLLDEASAEERARVEAALERSPELRAERDRIAATIELVREAVPAGEVLGTESAQRLAVAADAGAEPTRARSWLPTILASTPLRVAASVAVLALAYAAWRTARLDSGAEGSTDTLAQVEEATGAAVSARRAAEPAPPADAARFAGDARDYRPAADPAAEPEDASVMDLDASTAAVDAPAEASMDAGAAAAHERQQQQPGLEALSRLGYVDGSAPGRAGERSKEAWDERTARVRDELGVDLLERGAAAGRLDGDKTPGLATSAGLKDQAEKLGDQALHMEADAPPTTEAARVETLTLEQLRKSEAKERPSAPSSAAAPSGPGSPGPSGGGSGGGRSNAPPPNPPTAGGGSGGGGAYRGPGDTTPPGVAAGSSDGFFLGKGQQLQAPPSEETPVQGAARDRLRSEVRRLEGLGYAGGDRRDAYGRGPGGATHGPCEPDPGLRGSHLSPTEREAAIQEECRRLLDCCRRYPNETPRAMFFRFWGDNPFELAALDPLSTFSVDVDTASYALARRYLNEGHLPTKAQVRTEEFVNYFRPDIAPPLEETFRVQTELAPSRFGERGKEQWMLRVGLRGREVSREERKPLSLTFVVDTSGSMKENNRLELVKHALRRLVAELDANDTLAIVAFSKEARLVLPMTSAGNRGLVEAAVYGLHPDGGTNAEAGLIMGYAEARQHVSPERNDRVVFLSDGVANIGQTDQDRINEKIRDWREEGVFLNTVGVGMGNHNDVFLEQLADKGDGICNYVDSEREVQRALVENFTGAFEPIARNVKIQVEFDPRTVLRYRLLGYENRAIADQDFRNDAVDAGEVGAGHQVVALYELELASKAPEAPLATVRVRWLPPDGPREGAEATEIAHPVSFASATSFEGAGTGYRRSVLVAQFAELLRRSRHARGDSLDDLIVESTRLARELRDPDWLEFVGLLERSRQLVEASTPAYDELTGALDTVRYNCYLEAQLERLRGQRAEEQLEQLRKKNADLERLILDLVRDQVEGR